LALSAVAPFEVLGSGDDLEVGGSAVEAVAVEVVDLSLVTIAEAHDEAMEVNGDVSSLFAGASAGVALVVDVPRLPLVEYPPP